MNEWEMRTSSVCAQHLITSRGPKVLHTAVLHIIIFMPWNKMHCCWLKYNLYNMFKFLIVMLQKAQGVWKHWHILYNLIKMVSKSTWNADFHHLHFRGISSSPPMQTDREVNEWEWCCYADWQWQVWFSTLLWLLTVTGLVPPWRSVTHSKWMWMESLLEAVCGFLQQTVSHGAAGMLQDSQWSFCKVPQDFRQVVARAYTPETFLWVWSELWNTHW